MASVRLKPREKWVNPSPGLTFIFLQAGGGQCLWRKASHPLAPGDVVVLNAASGAQLSPATTRKLLFSCFYITLEHLFPLFGLREIALAQGITDHFKAVTVYPGPRALATKCHRLLRDVPPELDLDHRGQLLRIVAAILSFEFKNAQPRRYQFTPVEAPMSDIFDKLSTAEILTLPVTKLADWFNCTRRHLTRLFHQQFGCSVSTLRMEIRLLRAVSLLRNPQLTVGEVALQCGFNHRSLFNQCFNLKDARLGLRLCQMLGKSPGFKRRFDSTPTEWQTAALEPGTHRMNPANHAPDCQLRIKGLCPWTANAADFPD